MRKHDPTINRVGIRILTNRGKKIQQFKRVEIHKLDALVDRLFENSKAERKSDGHH